MTLLKRLAVLAALGAFSSPVAAQTEIIFNTYLPVFEVTQQVAVREFAERIEAESKGDIDIHIPDVSLAPIDRQYEMILDGISDMAFIPTNTVPQIVALNRIADLPGHAPSATAASQALWATYKEHFEALNEYQGLVVLSVHALPGRQFMSIKKPLEEVADFQGMKLWTPPGAMSEIVTGLGGVPVMEPFTSLHENVSKGTVEGLVITPDSANSARVLEEARFQTKIDGGLGSISFAVVIREERWNELNDEQRAAIVRAAEGLPARTGAAVDAREAEVAAKFDHLAQVEPSVELAEAIKPILAGQIETWKQLAKDKGLADPDAAIATYRAALAAAQ
ncbi:TRAP transporter substrate-binding protein DctP [Devosia sp. MC532]|uniref:TRAP transporter substrate-binding protein DctP n=1 Tax=Devosia sp. MC532 TaxID=2799788 RepID=UPI0018F64EA8|nr:TRAP transporter substrate-binding protein DctP [Devosia sp. MC532]MBJ7576823.1 TRAP transporter substrate-binding protein DctP [Devosia sp. MC532]